MEKGMSLIGLIVTIVLIIFLSAIILNSPATNEEVENKYYDKSCECNCNK